MKPGISAITGMLATIWMRCCYVFLDSNFAPERLATMITDCGMDVILFETELQCLANDLLAHDEAHPKLINILEAKKFEGRIGA